MRLVGLVLFAVLLAGCTHRYSQPPPVSSGDRFTVETAGGERIRAMAMVRGGTVLWRSADSGRILPATELVAYERKRHGRGALEGLLIGLGSGAAAGALVGLASGNDECPQGEWCIVQFTAGQKAGILGIGFGIVGAVTGGIIGAIMGSTDRYETRAGAWPALSLRAWRGGGGALLGWRF